MPDVLIRAIPKKTLDAVKRKAARRGRSLQQELKLAIERLGAEADFDYVEYVAQVRERIASYALNQSDSVDLLREDRKR